MNLPMRREVICLIAASILGCSPYYVHHDEQLAARRALAFCKTAILNHDIDSAYVTLSDQLKAQINADGLKETIARMHPTGYPVTIQAVSYDFDFAKNPKIILINLLGKGPSGEDIHYQAALLGDKKTDYKIIGVVRFPRSVAISKVGHVFPDGQSDLMAGPVTQPNSSPNK
jgi:hypothetical protein